MSTSGDTVTPSLGAVPVQPTRFTRDVVWAAASLATFALAGAAWAVMTAHGLGAGGRGNLSLIGLAIMLSGLVCSVGSGYTLPTLLSDRAVRPEQLVGSTLALGVVVNAAVLLFAASVGSQLTIEAIFGVLIVALLTLLPASWIKTVLAAVLSAHRDFKSVFWAALLGHVAQLSMGGVLLATGTMTLGWAVAANTVGALVTLAALIPPARRFIRLSELGPSRGALLRVFRAGTAALPGVVGQSLNYRLDLLLVAALAGAQTVGIYVIAVLVAETLFYPSLIVSQVLLPRAAQMKGEHGSEPAYRVVLAATLMLGVGLWLAAPVLVPTIFGREFLEASPGIRLLVPGVLALALWQLATFELVGRGKMAVMSVSALAGVVVTLAADVVLVPQFNVRGAAGAATIGYVVTALIVLVPLRREMGYRLVDLVVPRRSDFHLVASEAGALFGRQGSPRRASKA